MSVLLDQVRRDYWAEKGEPERPPSPPLGLYDEEVATGDPYFYSSDRDGPDAEAFWRRHEEKRALAAEAQAAWEERARRDAAEWRTRVEDEEEA